jgi:hypothetical protein
LVVSLIAVASVVWYAAADRATAMTIIEQQTRMIADHENRLRCLEQQSSTIANDVSWIRNRLEQK